MRQRILFVEVKFNFRRLTDEVSILNLILTEPWLTDLVSLKNCGQKDVTYVSLQNYQIFSDQLFHRTPVNDYFWAR